MGWETWRPEGYKAKSSRWEDWEPQRAFGEIFDIKDTPKPETTPIQDTAPKVEAPKLSIKDIGKNAFNFLDKNISAPLATGYNDFMLNIYKASGGDNERILKNLEEQSRTTREKYQSEDNSYLKNLGTGLLENAGAMFGGPQGGYAGLGQTLGNAVTPSLAKVGLGGKALETADQLVRLSPMYQSSKGGAIRNAEEYGLNEKDTKKYALINGLAEVGTEMMYMPDWFKKSIGMDLGDALPTTFKDSLKDYIQDAVAEGGEEVISGAIQNFADKKILGLNRSREESLKDARDNFVGGAVFSGVLGLPSLGSYKANAQYLESLNNEFDKNTDGQTQKVLPQPELNDTGSGEPSPNNDLGKIYDLIDQMRNPKGNLLQAPQENTNNSLIPRPNNNIVAQPQMTQDFQRPSTPIANVTGLGNVKVVDVDTSSNLPAVIIETQSGEQFPIRQAIAQNSMSLIEQPNFEVDGQETSNLLPTTQNNFSSSKGQAVDPKWTSSENNNSQAEKLPQILNYSNKKLLSQPNYSLVDADTDNSTTNATTKNNNTNSDVTPSNRVYSVDVNNINVDADTFQFKSNTDSQGVTNQFKNGEQYDPYKAGVVTLYRDTDNKLYVVNGHHRLEFAKRSGVNRIDAQILNSSDGWSKSDARTLGAKINMAEGKGTAIDSAKIFRENNLSLDDIKKDGISLSDSKIRTGFEISKLSQPLFNAVATGKLSENKGAIIGRELEGSVSKQQEVFNLVKNFEKKGKNITDSVLSEIIQMAKASDTHKEQQQTLFGLEEFEKSNMIQRGEVISGIKSRLSKEKKLFSTLTNKSKADMIKAVGNKLADKSNAQNLSEAELGMGILDTFKNAKGHSISDAISLATDKYAKGEITKQQAIDEALNSIKNIIKSGELSGKNNEGNTNRSSKMLNNGTGTQGKNEYEQTTTQRNNITKARTELEQVKSRFKISNKRGKDYYLKQGFTGLGISADFINNKNLSLIGQKISSYRDLAEISQIYRDPRWETFRVVLVKGNNVVGETGITCHIPNESKIYKNNYDSEIKHLKNYMKKVGADGYYLLHNHPSGNPQPSNADIRVTNLYQRDIKGFKGHVIINSNKFGLIENQTFGELSDTVFPLNYEGEGKKFEENILKPSIPNNVLGTTINGTKSFAEIYKQLEVTGDKFTVVYTNNLLEVRGIQQIHNNNLNNYENLVGYLGNQMRGIGATNNFIVAPSNLSKEHMATLTRMGVNNITTDIMTIENETWRGNRYNPKKNMPDAIERQASKNRAKRINGVQEQKEEYIGDNFYSQMEKVVDNRLGKKITATELDKNINAWVKKGEIKAEEVKWSGIKEWLQDLGDTTLSKNEVMEQLKNSRLIINKITTDDSLGVPEQENKYKEIRKTLKNLENKVDSLDRDLKIELDNKYSDSPDAKKFVELYIDDNIGVFDLSNSDKNILNNYLKDNKFSDLKKICDEIFKFDKEYGELDEERRATKKILDEKAKTVTTTQYNKYISNGGENYKEILFQIDSSNLKGQKDFDSPHFAKNNIIAHARTTDRKTVSSKDIPKREKVLYLEEVQSDLHQKGRENGYIDSEQYHKLDKQYKKSIEKIKNDISLLEDREDGTKIYGRKINNFNEFYDFWDSPTFNRNYIATSKNNELKPLSQLDSMANSITEFEDIYNKLDGQVYICFSNRNNYLFNKNNPERSLIKLSEYRNIKEIKDMMESNLTNEFDDKLVTDAPFSKTWDEFIIKNMIQRATEEGYDRIAWTTGIEQSQRYGMAKIIDKIEYKIIGSPTGDTTNYGITAFKNGEPVFFKYFYDKKSMAEYIGKDITNKIYNGEGADVESTLESKKGSKTLAFDELTIGSKGMTAFYDKMLVNSVNKYVKKWKSSVEQVPIERLGERNSIKITDEMKKDVTENGQAIYERKVDYEVDKKLVGEYGNVKQVVLTKANTNMKNQTAKFGQNYREILFKADGVGVNYKFRKNDADTRGVLSFARTTDRTSLDGKKVLYLEEVASYEHQNTRSLYYPEDKNLERAKRIIKDSYTKDKPTEVDLINRGVYSDIVNNIDKDMPENYSKYTRRWLDITMANVINRAINEGYDSIAWTTGDERAKIIGLKNASGLNNFYSKDLVDTVNKLVGKYNAPITTQNIKYLGAREGIVFSDELKDLFSKANNIESVKEYTSNYNQEKERKHYETYSNSDAISPEIKKIIENTDKHYKQLGNEKVWNTAKDLVENRYNYARELVLGKKTLENAYDVAISEAILLRLQREGNWEEASRWADRISEKLTQAGQVVQAASLIGRMTPEGILRTANRMLKKTSSKKKREISEKIIENIDKDFKDINDEALKGIIDKLLRYAKKKGIPIEGLSIPVERSTGEKIGTETDKDFGYGDKDLDREEGIIGKALKKKGGRAVGPNGTSNKNKDTKNPSEKLASKVNTHIPKPKFKKNEPLNDMVNVLYGVAKQVLPAKNKPIPKSPFELINQAMVNREEYAICWNMAKEIVQNKWAGNQEALDLLNIYFEKYLDKPFSDNLMNKAINNAMDTLDINLDELVRKHYSEVDFAQDSIKDKFIFAGLSESEAQELSDFIENEFRVMTEKKKNQILNKALKSKPKTKKQKELWEKVIEFSNLGAFEKDDFKSLVADKLGMGTLTPELAEDLVTRANHIQTLPDGDEKNVEIQLMMDRIYAQVPPSTLSKVSTVQAIAQLLNPMTYIRNYLGNVGFGTIDRYITYIPAKMVDKLVSKKTGENTIFAPHPLEYRRGYKEGKRIAKRDADLGINTRKSNNSKFDTHSAVTFRPEHMNKVERFFKLDKLEKLMNKSLTGTDIAFKEGIIRESLYSQMKNANVTEPTPEMIEIANQLADYRTFNNDTVLSSFFSNLKSSLNSPTYTYTRGAKGNKNAWGLGDMLIKYPKTPANIVQVAIDYSPAGLVSSIYKLWYSSKSTEVEFNQQAFSNGIGRGLVGSTLIAVGIFLAKLGILTGGGDDDKDLQAIKNETGFGQYRINLSALDRLVGTGFDSRYAKPQQNDLIVNYDWFQPLAIPVAIGANIESRKDDDLGIVGSIVNGFNAGVDTLMEQPLVSGIKRFTQTRQITEAVTNMVQDIPSSFIPTFVNQIKKLLDNQSRITYDNDWLDQMENKVKVKLPVLNKSLEPNIDTLGREKETYQNGSNNPFNVFLNPSFTSRYNVNETYKKALSIYEKTGAKEHLPVKLQSNISFEGKTYKLTATEYTYYQKKVGQATVEIYKSAKTEGTKAQLLEESKRIANAISDAKSEVRDAIIKKRGIESVKPPSLNKYKILNKY